MTCIMYAWDFSKIHQEEWYIAALFHKIFSHNKGRKNVIVDYIIVQKSKYFGSPCFRESHLLGTSISLTVLHFQHQLQLLIPHWQWSCKRPAHTCQPSKRVPGRASVPDEWARQWEHNPIHTWYMWCTSDVPLVRIGGAYEAVWSAHCGPHIDWVGRRNRLPSQLTRLAPFLRG